MVITYYGGEFFKVQFGDTVLAFNPPSKKSKYKSGRFSADIVLSSLNHDDFNGTDTVNGAGKDTFVITGPGEYEIAGTVIKALPSTSLYDVKEMINTIYLVSLENMNLCFLGPLGSTELPADTASQIDEIDILFIPILGDGILGASEAYKYAVKLEPRLIIPMHFNTLKDDSIKTFLKEAGDDSVKPQDKLTVKLKDLKDKSGDVVVLKPQG